MERWGTVNNPFVKVVAGFTVPSFLALNFPAIFLAFVSGLLFYAIALVGVAHAYRRSHHIVGRPEVLARLAVSALTAVKEGCDRTVARGLQEHQRRNSLKREKRERLRRYRRELNRRKREQAREALAQQR